MSGQTPTTSSQTHTWQERLQQRDPGLHIHLIGIGGAGLSAIATVLLEVGVRVSGSDREASARTARLADAGATVLIGQSAANLDPAAGLHPDVVLISSAVAVDNPERAAAASQGIPVVKRDDFLPVLLATRRVVGVAGTHGKTTTTAMIVTALRGAGLDVGYIVGADIPGLGNAAAGSHPLFVIEADEYDYMFLGLQPAAAVITNVEWDHPDCYPTPASFRRAFMRFVDRVDRDGMVVTCADDEGAEKLRAFAGTRRAQWLTYGVAETADLRATDIAAAPGGGISATVHWWHAPAVRLDLQVPGTHNLENAMAALAIANWANVPMDTAAAALQAYTGSTRRFEVKGEAAGVIVIDDYAHHPTEIMATLAAARGRFPTRRIWAVFQPHTFSRTARMLYRMGDSFAKADRVIVTDIYAARETDDGTVSAAELVAASAHPDIRHIRRLADAADFLAENVAPGDVVITLGAGDVNTVGAMLLDALRARAGSTA